MKRRFGLAPIFGNEDGEEGNNETTSNVVDYAGSVNKTPQEDDDIEHKLETFDIRQDQKLGEAERVSEKVSEMITDADALSKTFASIALSAGSFAKYVESTKGDIRSRYETSKENESLWRQNQQLSNSLSQSERELESAQYEIESLRKSGNAVQQSLKEARDSIHSMRYSTQKTSDLYKVTMVENGELKEHLKRLEEQLKTLEIENNTLSEKKNALKDENEKMMKDLVATNGDLEEKNNKVSALDERNKSLTAELSSISREVVELRDEKVTVETRYKNKDEELDAFRRNYELDQRKHDNEVYSLRSEVENITSQWRLEKTNAKEINAELRALRESERQLKQNMSTLEVKLEEAQDERNQRQDEIPEQSQKYAELNLQYETLLIDVKQERAQVAELQKTVKRLSEDRESSEGIRIKYEAAADQIRELKTLIQTYQLKRAGNSADDVEPVAEDESIESQDEAEDAANIVPLERNS